MAKAREPRPRRLSAVFGAYFLLVIGLAFYLSPSVAPYVDPGATFWILTAYVALGALALTGVCAGALRRAIGLDTRIDEFEAVRRRAQRAPESARARASSPRPVLVLDSGSPEHEVEALLDGLQQITDAASADLSPDEGNGAGAGPAPGAIEDLLRADEREIERVRKARNAVARTMVGPAVAAAAIVGVVAALLPASDGMLLSNLQINAFVGVAGLGCLVGLGLYAAAAFRQIRRRAL